MKEKKAFRVSFIVGFFALFALILMGKAMQIQVLDSSYQVRAKATTREKRTIYPARGSVYDRHENLLVYNIPIYDLMVRYNQINPKMDTVKFCKLLGIKKKEFIANLDKNWQSNGLSRDRRYSKAKPFPLLSRLSVETYARIQESLYQFPGFFVQFRTVRGYPNPNGAHVLGYLREVNQGEIDDDSTSYILGDYIGASGIELQYDSELRGKKGHQFLLRDNKGREVGSYLDGEADSTAISGLDLMLSLDLQLQNYAEELMQNKAGGIIAIEPKTGEILTMVSAPFYDPNLLVFNRDRSAAYRRLNEDPDNVFFNRATMAEYPPGSLFKPIVGLIALNEEATQLDRTIACYNGYYLNGIVRPACHSHPTCTNMSQAIQHSCNAYFAHVFRNIIDSKGYTNAADGLDVFTEYLQDFGIGHELNIDFPQEKRGNYPTSAYYNRVYKGANWYSPYIMSLGIGQGEMLLTTVQMANAAAAIANRGYFYTPHLAKKFMKNGKSVPYAMPKRFSEKHEISIKDEYFDAVVTGMENVVLAGTARSALVPEIAICGKTGTAENPHGEDHSIFFAFAPKDNPKIAIAVYIEHGRFGGTIAAPTASLLIEKYLTGKIAPARKYREEYVKNYQPAETTP